MSKVHALTVGLIALALASGCQDRTNGAGAKSITDALAAQGRFTTLVNALEAADLTGRLRNEGPFTLFAPTDRAFDTLADGTVDALLTPAHRGPLREILTYHLVGGKVVAIDLIGMRALGTLSGEDLNVTVINGKILINDAVVIQADLTATNGVIHVIDDVLLPEQPSRSGRPAGASATPSAQGRPAPIRSRAIRALTAQRQARPPAAAVSCPLLVDYNRPSER
ncbi:MAG: fasciclin domain-containing protein [Planctomycetota bacterium]